MKIQTLVATMHQKDHSLAEKMKLEGDCIVINQTDNLQSQSIQTEDANIVWINSDERGLSKSRNLALGNSKADICLLADDDLEYVQNYTQIIKDQFEKNPGYDIITFQVEGIEREFKRYYSRKRELNLLTSMKVSSVEVAMRMDKIRRNNIQFSNLLGAGSKYIMGEENAFLFECIKKGLKVMYVPIKIADLHICQSSWFEGFNEQYFISKGAMFSAMTKRLNWLLSFQFAVRKYQSYKKDMSFLKALKYMHKGKKQYLEDIGYKNSKQTYMRISFALLFKLIKQNPALLFILSGIGLIVAFLCNMDNLLTLWGFMSMGLGVLAGLLTGIAYLIYTSVEE